VRLVHQALTGLQHIHERGMVHRDLKPANLMLVANSAAVDGETTLKSTVKILDIGLARQLFEEGQPLLDPRSSELTAEGVLLGTPDYLAPEQARDPRNIDIRADIYSLGCVLFHALTGQPPFPDRNILGQMVRHATEKPKPLRDFNPQIPDGLQQIMDWMLAKKAEERYPTPERAAQALQMFLLADDAPARPIEDGAQMRSYLTWLETRQKGQAETVNVSAATVAAGKPGPDAAAVPAAKAAPAPVPAKPVSIPAAMPARPASTPPAPAPARSESRRTPRPPHKKKHKRRRDGSRRDAPIAAPAPAATVAAAPAAAPAAPVQFDVELVAAEPPSAPPWKMSTRDWVLLGIGSAAMIVLGAILWVIVALTRS
jgi:hypothetical protein